MSVARILGGGFLHQEGAHLLGLKVQLHTWVLILFLGGLNDIDTSQSQLVNIWLTLIPHLCVTRLHPPPPRSTGCWWSGQW